MKKFGKSLSSVWGGVFKVATLFAMVLALTCFAACSSDDDDPAVVSTWEGDLGTLTMYDNDTWTCVNEDRTFNGTYDAITATWLLVNGDVQGGCTIIDNKTLKLKIEEPSTLKGSHNFTKKK